MNYMVPANEIYDLITKKVRVLSTELIIGNKCQNSCKYCYVNHLQMNSPIKMLSPRRIKLYFNNAYEMGLLKKLPIRIEFFGGDPVIDLDYFKMLLNATDEFAKEWLVPTNGKLLQELSFKQLDELIYKNGKGKLKFSLSVDSPFQDINRPLSQFGKMMGYRPENDYDKLIKIAKRYKFGFHPMLYFNTADKWFDTFKFFVDRDVHPYLLEIRHPLTKEQAITAVLNIGKIVYYVLKYRLDIDRYNTTRPSKTPRGLGCSALNSLTINYDGRIYVCHRLRSEPYMMADTVTKEVSVRKLIMWFAGYDLRNSPVCLKCPLRDTGLCAGMCLGAMAEYWGRKPVVGLPIPSLCKLYYPLKVEILQRLSEQWRYEFDKIDKNHFYDILYQSFSPDEVNRLYDRIISEVDKL